MSAQPDPAGRPPEGAPCDATRSEPEPTDVSSVDSSLLPTRYDSSDTAVGTPGAPDIAVTVLDPAGTVTRESVGTGQVPHRAIQITGYDVLELLGRGGMGLVYRARQRGLKRIVALKTILAGSGADVEDFLRFRSEAEAVARLQHPNIVQIYEVGEEEGQPYFSLEFVDGESLAKRTAGAPQPPREAVRLVSTLARAVAYAHQSGVIHRDLKPANILLTREGVPKISDFGLAKRLEDDSNQTRSGSILGTPSYMAPEQAEGRTKAVGPRADVYALGAVLYELLTGRPPFRGATLYDTLHQVRNREPVAPSQLQPKVPRDLETICLKCLQKDPDKRYQSAQALADELERFADGTPILARPVGGAERLGRWCRRNPRIAALSGAVVGLLATWALSSSLLATRLAREKAATAKAAALALANETRANAQAAVARKNAEAAAAHAEEARRHAQRADEEKALVERNETSARAVAQIALDRIVRLGTLVRRRLYTATDESPAGRQLRAVRQDFDALLAQTVTEIAQNTGVRRSDPERMAAVRQQLGDLQARLGQGEDAVEQFRIAFELLDGYARSHPDDDRAQANVGTMLARLGDTAQQLNGDAAAALGYFARAWDVQESLRLHPRSRFYSSLDHTRLLSHYALKRGIACLHLGAPDDARHWVGEAVTRRRAWVAEDSKSVPAVSYLAEALMWAGTAACHTGDRAEAESAFTEALAIYAKLTQQFPRSGEFLGDHATIAAAHAGALSRWGALGDARTAYERALAEADVVVAHDPDTTEKQRLRATVIEGLAALALRQEKPDDARVRYRDALEVRQLLAGLEPQNLPAAAGLALALAHCGRLDDAGRRADELRSRAPQRVELLVETARCYAACASRAQDGERPRYIAALRDALRAAIAQGYKDVVALHTDPDLLGFQDDEGVKAILSELKKR